MDRILPRYRVVFEKGTYGILGTEETTGEIVFLKQVSYDERTAEKLAEILCEKEVSVFHARDVIRDILIAGISE